MVAAADRLSYPPPGHSAVAVPSPLPAGPQPRPGPTHTRLQVSPMNDPRPLVLVVEDDPDFSDLECALLEAAGFAVICADSVAAAHQLLGSHRCAVVVLDLVLPDGSGLEVFQTLRAERPGCPVIFMTGTGGPQVALETLQGGAYAFLQKSSAIERLLQEVDEAYAASETASPEVAPSFSSIVTQSSTMRRALGAAQAALHSTVPVLILGESGTGKELVARALHDGATARPGEFVAINCAGVPEGLLESELFGHEQGAFTGATQRRLGHFELASGGTLFLDEIGEMAPILQAKLLRVLQTGEFRRVGGTETRQTDARVLSATHCDLTKAIEEGRFRGDLYYRLAVFSVHLPPLRERAGDVPLLTETFIAKAARREGRRIDGIDPMALRVLCDYSFPGNVRQLENVLSHAVLSTSRDVITLMDLPERFLRAAQAQRQQHELDLDAHATPSTAAPPSSPPLPTLAEMEMQHIRVALAQADGNKAEAARLLGVSRMTLYRKLREAAVTVQSEDLGAR